MDYFDSGAGKARLALAKYQATVSNKKGTLFVNPGTNTTYGEVLMELLMLGFCRGAWRVWFWVRDQFWSSD